MNRFGNIIAVALLFVRLGSSVCGSYGKDFVHGGTYCIDTRSDNFFSFGTGFFGCTPEDSQGGVDPIVVAPNNDDVLCSTIQTQPDDENMISTCNLAGNEIRKSQMISGNFTVVIEGLTFAYARVFSIIAGPPAEVTSTATMTVTETSTPMTTVTTTTTSIIPTTLAPVTVTLPSTTSTRTVTVTPKRVTSTTTNIKTLTLPAWPPKITKTTVTKTVTTSCKTAPRRNDPTCTIHPPKASLAAAADPRSRHRRHADQKKPRAPLPENANNNYLARRTPDLCTTTVLASSVVTTTTTSTAPTSTVSSTVVEITSSTITPPPVTVHSGAAEATITTTLPTQTVVVTLYSLTTVKTTPTYTATITKTVKVAPSGKACLA